MSEQGIRARNGKGFKYSKHSLTMNNVSDNLLWRNSHADNPNEKLTSDITCIWVKNKWLYLATAMYLYSRRIVGWSVAETMTEVLIEDALTMAFDRRNVYRAFVYRSSVPITAVRRLSKSERL